MVVEALPGSKIDGACFWLDPTTPVIAMSLRFDRIDNFWFVLRHELEHVLQRHGQSAPVLDIELDGGTTTPSSKRNGSPTRQPPLSLYRRAR